MPRDPHRTASPRDPRHRRLGAVLAVAVAVAIGSVSWLAASAADSEWVSVVIRTGLAFGFVVGGFAAVVLRVINGASIGMGRADSRPLSYGLAGYVGLGAALVGCGCACVVWCVSWRRARRSRLAQLLQALCIFGGLMTILVGVIAWGAW